MNMICPFDHEPDARGNPQPVGDHPDEVYCITGAVPINQMVLWLVEQVRPRPEYTPPEAA